MITWRWVTFAATVFMSAMVAIAVINRSFTLAIIGFGVAIPVIYYSAIKAKTTGETIQDEMTWKISADSALWTFSVLLPIIAVVAIVFVIGSDFFGDWAEPVGFTMSMIVLMFGLTYTIMSLYKGRKLEKE